MYLNNSYIFPVFRMISKSINYFPIIAHGKYAASSAVYQKSSLEKLFQPFLKMLFKLFLGQISDNFSSIFKLFEVCIRLPEVPVTYAAKDESGNYMDGRQYAV